MMMCTQSNFDMIGIQVLLEVPLDFGLAHNSGEDLMSYSCTVLSKIGKGITCVFFL